MSQNIPDAADIPVGARVTVRVEAGIDPRDHRMKYSHFMGHVVNWDGSILTLDRDPSRDGTRPVQRLELKASQIRVVKPIPERRDFPQKGKPFQSPARG